jgi:hypothetical protein
MLEQDIESFLERRAGHRKRLSLWKAVKMRQMANVMVAGREDGSRLRANAPHLRGYGAFELVDAVKGGLSSQPPSHHSGETN